jgi:hypothetical protein
MLNSERNEYFPAEELEVGMKKMNHLINVQCGSVFAAADVRGLLIRHSTSPGRMNPYLLSERMLHQKKESVLKT